MEIHEVENMTVAELKARKEEILAAVAGNADLADRYFQARLDASLRDVTLAEQAKTLGALQTGLEAAKRDAEAQGKLIDRQVDGIRDAREQMAQLERASVDAEEEHKASLARMKSAHEVIDTAARGSQQVADKEIADLTAKCERLYEQATKATKVLATCRMEAYSALSTVVAAAGEALSLEELEAVTRGK